MLRAMLVLCLAAVIAPLSAAHFIYAVPAPDGKSVLVVFSDTLDPDPNVAIEKIAGLKLTARDAANAETVLTCKADADKLVAPLPADARVAAGTVIYGITAKGGAKPALLVYHPKALLPGAADRSTEATLEVVAEPGDTGTRFRLLAAGKPVPKAAGNVLLPDYKKQKVETDDDGYTQAFTEPGRYGVWIRHTEAKAGEHDGKPYEEIKHYATLVADIAAKSAPVPPLPVGVSSLGAAAAGGYLYVYGGHAGKTHTYDTESILGTFQRLKLDGGTAWEPLPGGPSLQGLNLVAHNDTIIRVGGMTATNAPGEPSRTDSTAEVARFHPARGTWEPLPPLPEPRSSHDVVLSGNTLVVVGGWQMRAGAAPIWHETAAILDLNATPLEWKSVPQPFVRRALTAAAVDGKVVVVAGLTDEAKQSQEVDVFEVASQTWSRGPALPGSRTGFSPAATVVAGQVIVSASDGRLHRLNTDHTAWEPVGPPTSKRRVHRLIPHADGVLLVGGASAGGNATELEAVPLATAR